MKKTAVSSGNCAGVLLALIVFIVGVAISFTGIGMIIGIPLCILALFMGGKTRKVWKCKACGSIIERA